MENRFGRSYDAVLHLLDRQVIDPDGLLVCKVDDLELSEVEPAEESSGEPRLRVTALLTGPAALMPRFGHRMLDFWQRLGDERDDRSEPYRIGLDTVSEVTNAVYLTRPRHGLMERCVPPRRLSDLLALRVRSASGDRLGRVLDVRLDQDQVVVGLIVGPGRPGSLLGYDRYSSRGPALVRACVRLMHRHAGYVRWSQVAFIDREARELVVDAEADPQAEPLSPATGEG